MTTSSTKCCFACGSSDVDNETDCFSICWNHLLSMHKRGLKWEGLRG